MIVLNEASYNAAHELANTLRLPENADVLARFVSYTPGSVDMQGKPRWYPFAEHIGLLLQKYQAISDAIREKHGVEQRDWGGVGAAARDLLDGKEIECVTKYFTKAVE